MEVLMAKLLEELQERVKRNLSALKRNELKIKTVLAEPETEQRGRRLSDYAELSKRIIRENGDILSNQQKIVDFLSKHKSVSISDTKREDMEENHKASIVNQKEEKPEPFSGLKDHLAESKFLNLNQAEETKHGQSAFDSDLDKTVQGIMVFNETHPWFYDRVFYTHLLNYHIAREEYELCAQIKNSRYPGQGKLLPHICICGNM